ncbi:MAG TPA: sigma-70 family RNA polymerase sigma factor [Bacillota bacterium]|nr:sigma-70 family RNA polymerase sigma factor [Bacillota bacterium]
MSGDPGAAGRGVEEHIGLVWSIVNRFRGRGEDLEELFQVGCVGLLKAADRFDPSYGTEFSTYAVPMVLGEIRRFLRDAGPVRVGRRLQEVAARAAQARAMLIAREGREPSLEEIASEAGLSPAELAQAREATRPVLNLTAPASDEDGAAPWLDRIAMKSDVDPADSIALRQALTQLPSRLRLIVELRFFSDCSQAAVARRLRLSQSQVSRLERQALLALKRDLEF